MENKDPDTALLIELVGGLFGFLGLGHFYVGRTNDGLVRLLVWFVFLAVGWTATALLSVILIGLLCIPVMGVAQLGIPIWSALSLKSDLEKRLSGGAAPVAALPASAASETIVSSASEANEVAADDSAQ